MLYNHLDLLSVFTEYSTENNIGCEIYSMDLFNDLFTGREPIDIVQAVSKDFNVHEDYFWFNGLEIESIDVWEKKRVIEDFLDEHFIKWLLDKGIIEPLEVKELDLGLSDYTGHNSNLYDLLSDFTVEYDTMEALINKFNVYLCDGIYYLDQYII